MCAGATRRDKISLFQEKATERRVARFFSAQHTKMGKIYQMTIKYTKWPLNIKNSTKYIIWPLNRSNGHKIYRHLPLKGPPKFTLIWISGLTIYHLATLTERCTPARTTQIEKAITRMYIHAQLVALRNAPKSPYDKCSYWSVDPELFVSEWRGFESLPREFFLNGRIKSALSNYFANWGCNFVKSY
jgi:hypothetical protein